MGAVHAWNQAAEPIVEEPTECSSSMTESPTGAGKKLPEISTGIFNAGSALLCGYEHARSMWPTWCLLVSIALMGQPGCPGLRGRMYGGKEQNVRKYDDSYPLRPGAGLPGWLTLWWDENTQNRISRRSARCYYRRPRCCS